MSDEKDLQPQAEAAVPAVETETSDSHAHDDHGHGAMSIEPEGINAGLLLSIVGVTVVIVVAVVIFAFNLSVKHQTDVRDQNATAVEYTERMTLDAEGEEMLSSYGSVEGEGEAYRIPIDRAIGLIATENYQDDAGDYSEELPIGASQ